MKQEERESRREKRTRQKKKKNKKFCTSTGLPLVVYQSDRNKPDRIVNRNDVVLSNRVAGRWRADGQRGVE